LLCERQLACGKLKVRVVLTAEGTDLNRIVESEIELPQG